MVKWVNFGATDLPPALFSYLSEFGIEVNAELDREKILEEPFLVV
jgi:hypothetical protein